MNNVGSSSSVQLINNDGSSSSQVNNDGSSSSGQLVNNSGSPSCETMVSEGFLQDPKSDPEGGKTTVLNPKCHNMGILVLTEMGYMRENKPTNAQSPFIVGLKSRNQLAREGLMRDEHGNVLPENYDINSDRSKVNINHQNYIYFRAPYVGTLRGDEKNDHERAESLYGYKFMNAAQIKQLTGKLPQDLFAHSSEVKLVKDNFEYQIYSPTVIFIRIDPTQSHSYFQGYRSSIDNVSKRTKQLIGSKSLVSEMMNKDKGSWEYEILLKIGTLTPEWFVYDEPYYKVHVRDINAVSKTKQAFAAQNTLSKEFKKLKKELNTMTAKMTDLKKKEKIASKRTKDSITEEIGKLEAEIFSKFEQVKGYEKYGYYMGGGRYTRRHRRQHRRTRKHA